MRFIDLQCFLHDIDAMFNKNLFVSKISVATMSMKMEDMT